MPFLSEVETEYNRDSVYALFPEIAGNGAYRTALLAVFMLLVTQWVSWAMDISLHIQCEEQFTFTSR